VPSLILLSAHVLQQSHGPMAVAYASVLSPEVQGYFAIAAFVLLAFVMGYCLFLIAMPHFSAVDKKWAKELLNTQLSFIGGLIVGIVVK